MQYTILLNKNDDTRSVELQEQSRFIKSIFEALEIPIEFNPDKELSPIEKQKFVEDLKNFKLHIISSLDRSLKIFVDQELIAEWKRPIYKLKQDLSQIDPANRLYLEAQLSCWSIFEEEQ